MFFFFFMFYLNFRSCRPGRLDRLVYVPLPDISSRVAICTVHLPECCSQRKSWSLRLSEATDGYTGAEIAMVCREASMFALREYLESGKKTSLNSEKETDNVPYTVILQWAHFEKALQVVQPRISSSLINFYKDYNKTLNL
jgi:transitional endoplasmic reticulum ATPase